MIFNNELKNIIRKYKLYCISPLSLAVVITIILFFAYTNENKNLVIFSFSIFYFAIILTVTILFTVLVCSNKKYRNKLKEIYGEDLEKATDEIVYNYNRVLVAKKAIVFYGFNNKKVIKVEDILNLKSESGVYKTNSAYSWSIKYNCIRVDLKDKAQEIINITKGHEEECKRCLDAIRSVH